MDFQLWIDPLQGDAQHANTAAQVKDGAKLSHVNLFQQYG